MVAVCFISVKCERVESRNERLHPFTRNILLSLLCKIYVWRSVKINRKMNYQSDVIQNLASVAF